MQYLPPASIAVGGGNNSSTNSSSSSSTASIFANLFASAPAAHGASFSDMIGNISRSERPLAADVPALCLAGPGSLFSQRQQFAPAPVPAQAPPTPHMSATALLQKAAQMGATASNSSFLRGFGLASSSSGHQESRQENGMQWHQQPPHHQQDPEPPMLSAALGLGLSYQHEMMGSSSLFGPKPSATLDFLGLGMRPGGSGTGGLSALITSMGSDLDEVDVAAPTGQFRGSSSSTGRGWESERKPAIL